MSTTDTLIFLNFSIPGRAPHLAISCSDDRVCDAIRLEAIALELTLRRLVSLGTGSMASGASDRIFPVWWLRVSSGDRFVIVGIACSEIPRGDSLLVVGMMLCYVCRFTNDFTNYEFKQSTDILYNPPELLKHP